MRNLHVTTHCEKTGSPASGAGAVRSAFTARNGLALVFALLIAATALVCVWGAGVSAWAEDPSQGTAAQKAAAKDGADKGESDGLISTPVADEAGVTGKDAAASDEDELDNRVDPKQLPDSSSIYDTSLAELATADSYHDGKTVQVTGEVVGDRIQAELDRDHCWIVLEGSSSKNASTVTLSVFMSDADAAKIDMFGKYGVKGTTLRVKGTFNLVCDEHDGVTDLHATQVNVAAKGSVTKEKAEFKSFLPGIILLILGLGACFAYRTKRQRLR